MMSWWRNGLREWWPMVLFMACAPLLVGTAPVFEPIAESLEVRSGQWGEEWVLRSLQVESTPAGLALHPGGDSTGLATRTLDLPAATRFVALQLCFGARESGTIPRLLMLSLRDGHPQENRQYRLYDLDEAAPGTCVEDAVPRFASDDAGAPNALLQVQVSGGRLDIAALRVQPLVETRAWRQLRSVALPVGLALLAIPFVLGLRKPQGRSLQQLLGLGTVAVIIFGCCISVELKAQIARLLQFDVMAAGAPPALEELLRTEFGGKGFGVFTLGHAGLFALAALLLTPGSRRAWMDLVLLALATESLQRFVPGRGPGLDDVLVDWSGLLLASLLLAALRFAQRHGLLPQQQGIGEDVAGLRK